MTNGRNEHYGMSEEKFQSLSSEAQQRYLDLTNESFQVKIHELSDAFRELGRVMRKETPIIDKFFKLIERVGD